MSTHSGKSGGRTRGSASSAKPTAVVERTHTERGTRWHDVTISYPDGTKAHVSVNAQQFPTRTAAKAEAVRWAQHGNDQNVAVVVRESKPTYASESARIGAIAHESSTAHEHLAALARGEGHTALAEAHDRAAAALRTLNYERARVAITQGQSRAAKAIRAESALAQRAAQAQLARAEDQIGVQRPTRGPQQESANPFTVARVGGTHAAQMRAYTSEYNRLAARFAGDIHGENRRQTYRDAVELRTYVADLRRAAEARLSAAHAREDRATTAKETAAARRAASTARSRIAQADTLWSTIWDLSAAARNNQETTQRWLDNYLASSSLRSVTTRAARSKQSA